jgi:hypothetical protein
LNIFELANGIIQNIKNDESSEMENLSENINDYYNNNLNLHSHKNISKNKRYDLIIRNITNIETGEYTREAFIKDKFMNVNSSVYDITKNTIHVIAFCDALNQINEDIIKSQQILELNLHNKIKKNIPKNLNIEKSHDAPIKIHDFTPMHLY